MSTSKALLEKYKRRLEFLDLAAATRYRYLRVAEMYLYYSKGKLSRDTVESFITMHRETSGTYRRFLMVVLKGFFGVMEVAWPFSAREMPKLSTPHRPFFTVEDVHKLLSVAEKSPLDYALIRVAASTGCRREELTRMMMVDYEPPSLVVRTAKGGDRRVRTLDSDTVKVLNSYLLVRRSKDSRLFVSEQGVALSPTTLGNRFRKIAHEAGFEKHIGLHAIRRGVTTWLFQGGLRERELQELMGWKSPAMPSAYIQLVASEVERKAGLIHPFSKIVQS